MYNIGEIILNATMVTVTLWIVNRFWSSFFAKKEKNIVTAVVWVLFAVMQFYFESGEAKLRPWMMIVNVGLFWMIVLCGYHSKGKTKYFLMVVFYCVWVLAEFIVFTILNSTALERSASDTLGTVASKILMIIFVNILPIAWDKNNSSTISNKYHFLLLLVPLGSLFIAINELISNNMTLITMISFSILLLFNVFVFSIYTKLGEKLIDENRNAVHAKQLDIISKSIVEQKKMMEEFHLQKHNLVNELIVLKNGIETNDEEKVISNLNRIINDFNISESISNSGNSTVDALINFKYALAKEYGINFLLKIHVPDELPIDQCDLGVVLGNTLDNAIEATKDCEVHEKTIEISMGIKKEAWVLLIKNPYEHKLLLDRNGNLLSTKQDKKQHGYGLTSVIRIAEKYNGEVITDYSENMFAVTVVMNFNQI